MKTDLSVKISNLIEDRVRHTLIPVENV